MPRDNEKNNDSRGGKGRSGAARGPEKKFAKRAGKDFAGRDGDKRPSAGRRDDARPSSKKPYSASAKPYAGKREGAPRRDYGDAPRPRGDRPFADRPQRFNRDERPRGEGEKRPYTPRGERANSRDDRAPRNEGRPASRFGEKKFGDRKPYTPRDGGGE